jgi:hypothetical protein
VAVVVVGRWWPQLQQLVAVVVVVALTAAHGHSHLLLLLPVFPSQSAQEAQQALAFQSRAITAVTALRVEIPHLALWQPLGPAAAAAVEARQIWVAVAVAAVGLYLLVGQAIRGREVPLVEAAVRLVLSVRAAITHRHPEVAALVVAAEPLAVLVAAVLAALAAPVARLALG